MADNSPSEILIEIKCVAREEWPADRDMQQYTINVEITLYRGMEDLDYGNAADHKPAILKEAEEYHTTWEGIYGFVSEEVEAFKALAALAPDDVPSDFVDEHKRKAAAEHDWFVMQLETVEQAIEGYRYVQRTAPRSAPFATSSYGWRRSSVHGLEQGTSRRDCILRASASRAARGADSPTVKRGHYNVCGQERQDQP